MSIPHVPIYPHASYSHYSVMGVFPIVMNVLQFWIIDSIVKASSAGMPPQLPVSSLNIAEDVEPLFSTPDSDDEDHPSGDGRASDIENRNRASGSRSRSRESTQRKFNESKDSLERQYVSANGESEAHEEAHSYPPIASSPTASIHSSLNARRQSWSPRSNLLSLRRSPPLPEELPMQTSHGSHIPDQPMTTPVPAKALGSVLTDMRNSNNSAIDSLSNTIPAQLS